MAEQLFCTINSDYSIVSVNEVFLKHFPSMRSIRSFDDQLPVVFCHIKSLIDLAEEGVFKLDVISEKTGNTISLNASCFIDQLTNNIVVSLEDDDGALDEIIIHKLFDATSDLVFIKNNALEYIYVNDAFSNFVSLPKNEIIGKKDADILPEEVANMCLKTDLKALENNFLTITEEGTVFDSYIETKKIALSLGNEMGIGGIIRDNTLLYEQTNMIIERELFVRTLFENLNEGIIVINTQYQITEINHYSLTKLNFFGSSNFATNANLLDVYPFTEIVAFKDKIDRSFTGSSHTIKHSFQFNQKTHIITIKISPLYNQNNELFYSTLVFEIDNEEVLLNTLLKAEIQKNRQLSKELLEFQEGRQMSIAAELHDNVSQLLMVGLFNLDLISTVESNYSSKAIKSIQHALNELKFIIRNSTIKNVLDLTLEDAFRSLIDDVQNLRGLVIRLTFTTQIELTSFEQLNIVRILQESLNNIARHAAATKVHVAFFDQDDYTILTVQDDGKGFNQTDQNSSGFGLQNIKNRVTLLGGQLDISSSDKGTIVQVTIRKTDLFLDHQ